MPPMRPPNVRACVEVSHRLTLEGHYGGVLIFLSSSVRAFVELVVCLALFVCPSPRRISHVEGSVVPSLIRVGSLSSFKLKSTRWVR